MKRYRVRPNQKIKLKKIKAGDTGDFPENEEGKERAAAETQKILSELDEQQELLYANAKRALLVVLQAMDTGGKDGTIEHVMHGINPQGCIVSSFKVPTPLEASHDFLWRAHQRVPPKGYIGIFNRSHYEDVLVTRVHKMIDDKTAEQRFKDINDFERLLIRNGTVIRKFFLHISKGEQKRRLEARLDDPKKHWKFSLNDVHERKFWNHYQKVYEDALRHTSTADAPWYVVPADKKWYRNYVIGSVIVEALKEMKLKYPPAPKGINFKTIRIPD